MKSSYSDIVSFTIFKQLTKVKVSYRHFMCKIQYNWYRYDRGGIEVEVLESFAIQEKKELGYRSVPKKLARVPWKTSNFRTKLVKFLEK